MTGTTTTQTDRILRMLNEHRGTFVPMTELASIGGCFAVHSRIADIRKRGVPVENRQRHDKQTGRRLSYYRIPAPEQPELSLVTP